MKVSIIIPVYNEEKVIGSCLESLAKQTVRCEIIVVDDGSSDSTKTIVGNWKSVILLHQDHSGPGSARNLGASKAEGDILVFVDADMEFENDFIAKLIAPISAGKTIGTFSKEEYLLNKENNLARCWNLNLGRKADRMHSNNYPNTQPVFRAILKAEFEKVGGFDTRIGYTDDWSLSRKLNILATVAPGAKYYHRNPETYSEVWRQARWFGKNEFLTRNIVRRLFNLFRYNIILSVIYGLIGMFLFEEQQFFLFKIVYDTAVFTSVFESFLTKEKYK